MERLGLRGAASRRTPRRCCWTRPCEMRSLHSQRGRALRLSPVQEPAGRPSAVLPPILPARSHRLVSAHDPQSMPRVSTCSCARGGQAAHAISGLYCSRSTNDWPPLASHDHSASGAWRSVSDGGDETPIQDAWARRGSGWLRAGLDARSTARPGPHEGHASVIVTFFRPWDWPHVHVRTRGTGVCLQVD